MRCLEIDEAIDRLQSPHARETWSPLGEAPMLALDARDGAERSTPTARAAAAVAIMSLPAPVAALADAAARTRVPELLAACDVVVASDEELAEVASGVAAAPLAAATLVQVLRAGAALDVGAALAVESMAYAALQAGPEHARWLAARPAAGRRAAEGGGEVVCVERTARELVLTLARPARHNAYSAAMRDALAAALAVALVAPELGVVLRGAGPSFCSGGDLDEFGTRPDPATAHLVRTTRSPAAALAALGARLRVEVHGACIGAGIELAAWGRELVAAPDAFFALPEVAMGLIPGAGGTASLPRRIGRQRTTLLALTGRRLDAATAHAWGLVDAVGRPNLAPAGPRSSDDAGR
ncbi:MAG: enoyl-CoA hydratase/isomerase family protein [Deltaproteobacteria bacterium]|nr:enoyl-CoA hydratase/isomerase family protein [Deltaproteobacteria bacterium]